MSAAAATPRRARAAISIAGLVENAASSEASAEGGGADRQHPAATDTVVPG